jgi:hypothetical protein
VALIRNQPSDDSLEHEGSVTNIVLLKYGAGRQRGAKEMEVYF